MSTDRSHPQNLHVLIIDPNTNHDRLYQTLSSDYHITRVDSTESGSDFVQKTLPNLVIVSCALPIEKVVVFLDQLRQNIHSFVPGLMLMIDTDRPTNTVVSVKWSGKLGVVCSESDQEEMRAVLERVVR